MFLEQSTDTFKMKKNKQNQLVLELIKTAARELNLPVETIGKTWVATETSIKFDTSFGVKHSNQIIGYIISEIKSNPAYKQLQEILLKCTKSGEKFAYAVNRDKRGRFLSYARIYFTALIDVELKPVSKVALPEITANKKAVNDAPKQPIDYEKEQPLIITFWVNYQHQTSVCVYTSYEKLERIFALHADKAVNNGRLSQLKLLRIEQSPNEKNYLTIKEFSEELLDKFEMVFSLKG